MTCYAELHRHHRCSDINQVDGNFRRQMSSDVEHLASGVEKFREMLERLEEEKKDFNEQVEKTAVKINVKADQLKQMIDDHREKLINKLSSMKGID